MIVAIGSLNLLTGKKLTDYEFEFINQNNDSYISSLILRRMIFERSIDFRLADSLLNNFSENIRKLAHLLKLKIIDDYNLTNSESPTIGALLPSFRSRFEWGNYFFEFD